jgi:hypothetical protein
VILTIRWNEIGRPIVPSATGDHPFMEIAVRAEWRIV